MNLDVIKMEIRRLRKLLVIALVAPSTYSIMIMVFYIAFSGVFASMQSMFDNASLQGLMSAFSMDSNTFVYILNYYVSYNGIYMLIMGIIFASSISVKLFSGELKSGTYEFLYANPISRVKLFISKTMVVVLYLVVLNMIVFLVGLVSIEVLKSNSPMVPWMSDENIEMLTEKVDAEPGRLNVFNRDDYLFYEVMYQTVESGFEVDHVDIADEGVSELLSTFLLNPDGIYDIVLESPDKYMKLYGIKDEGLFRAFIEKGKQEYFKVKDGFKGDNQLVLGLFKATPRPFLNQIIKDNRVSEFAQVFDLTEKEESQLFVYYSMKNYIQLSFATFVSMLSITMFILMLTVVVPGGRMTSGMASGVAFFFYFANMMGSIAEPVRALKYISPLSYINMDVMSVDYSTEMWAWGVMLGIIVISFAVALVTIRKGDLISG